MMMQMVKASRKDVEPRGTANDDAKQGRSLRNPLAQAGASFSGNVPREGAAIEEQLAQAPQPSPLLNQQQINQQPAQWMLHQEQGQTVQLTTVQQATIACKKRRAEGLLRMKREGTKKPNWSEPQCRHQFGHWTLAGVLTGGPVEKCGPVLHMSL